ncbi:ABC transporter permease [Succinimonas sp.]|uniref:ABC transporter permease n=1 Tax=Succinimonas sp. TaxID=1936151 RepID=UPI00386B7DCE
MAKALTIAVISCKDILHEWRMSFCVMFAVTAIATPLLIFFGLKSGIMETLRLRLLSNPATMEIISVNENRYEDGWFDSKRKDPLVSFVIPRTRRLAASAEFQASGGKLKKTLDLYPTAKGDPLLAHYGVSVPDSGSCVLTQEAARRIQADKGTKVIVTVSRDQGKVREKRELTVAGVLPDAAGMVAAAYIERGFLEQIEGFKDGFAVPELGWKGADSKAFPVVPEVILATDRRLDSVREAMLVQNTGFVKIQNVFAPDTGKRNDLKDIHPLLSSDYYIYKLSAVGMPAKKDDLAILSDKLRGRGDSWVIPANPYLTLEAGGKEFNLGSLTAFRKTLPRPAETPAEEPVSANTANDADSVKEASVIQAVQVLPDNSPAEPSVSQEADTAVFESVSPDKASDDSRVVANDEENNVENEAEKVIENDAEPVLPESAAPADAPLADSDNRSDISPVESFYDDFGKSADSKDAEEVIEEEEELSGNDNELRITLPKSSPDGQEPLLSAAFEDAPDKGAEPASGAPSGIAVYDGSLCSGEQRMCDFGKGSEERVFYASPEIARQLSGKKQQVKVSYFNYDKAEKNSDPRERAIEFAAEFRPLPELAGSDVILTSPELLGQLGLLSQRELADGLSSDGKKAFLLKRRGYTGFRMYASSLDDVILLQEKLTEEGIKTVSKADRISEILTLDRYLALLFWMIAAASIAGAACCLIANVYANVERKRKELAILRLLGVHGAHLCVYPLVCSIMLTSGGIIISFGVYAGLAYAVNDSFSYQLQGNEKFCHLDYMHFAATYLIAFGVATISGLVASRKVMNIDPSESLRDE